MQCPKCQEEMTQVAVQEGSADRCTGCGGLWFDAHESEQFGSSAAQLDTGSAERGSELNAIDRIRCPVCPDSRLIRMVDAGQPHIWFEGCPTCHGQFFDAGEFRDLSERTLGELIRSFSAKARD